MRNLSPARARRHKEAKCVLPIKSSSSTGAAQGIGRQTAEQAAAEGAALLLIDRSSYVHELAATLAQSAVWCWRWRRIWKRGKYRAGVCRRGRSFWPYRRADQQRWGHHLARPFAEYQPEQIEKEIRRSLFPTLWGCRAALPWMLKQGKGSIVNISSVATAGVNRVPYSAAKGGVNALNPVDCHGVQR
ncbi:1,2-dihydroxycyclohexa-3,5-diene-1-carboxylate dehydrogenase [Klebsiella pneumoniae]|uniref:1,2-dihydroxycyclohexa-3,5-diene-1-carboxylate dehydrogenase n=1 Tax=Klebsiella pneumoniae TaxID=573 RepID=A0A378C1V9_KLEPN|nr:1,2-dihydroxycyclohexa-3,5-diene-1-carboxylate dehydrogenase [Klebsiella pneumoniae]